MNLARILYPVEVLGPGRRIGIWFCGCNHRCVGCSNPELWDFQDKYRVSVEVTMKLIRQITDKQSIDGFTITGGDPFEQPEELNIIISELLKISEDIIVYTGYTLKELLDMKNSYIDNTISRIAVLIDGRYVESRNNGAVLRGSDNQQIHILNPQFQLKYIEYLRKASNKIQNFTASDGVISVGIHAPSFMKEFHNKVSLKGLEEKS